MGAMDTSMLNAFITRVDSPTAAPGPLGGMPFAVKDLIATGPGNSTDIIGRFYADMKALGYRVSIEIEKV